jgi:alanine racemase
MSRPARALLDASALRHNLAQVKRLAPRSRVLAVVKANGYGHGLAWVAATLNQADAFAVASTDEALLLRRAGITQPIVLLEGFFSADELPLLQAQQLAPVIHHEHQLRLLELQPALTPELIWIKLDTGMHRVGFAPNKLAAVLPRVQKLPVREIRLMTHFANADDISDPATRLQIESFRTHTAGQALAASLANSAGVVAWPDSHADWVRPGIMLYGAAPLIGKSASDFHLKPVMSLQTALIAVHRRRQGEAVGYGGDFRCPEDMNVGVATIGYGDGYPRHAPSGTPVLVNGMRVPLIGRVSMDMITLDLRSQPNAQVGDPVVLWGEGLPVDEIAAKAGTISYELLCHVTERIPRVVTK